MEQLEILENVPRRDLDNQDDIERLVDHNQEEEDRELKNKIIFNVQSLGGVRTIKHQDKLLEAYIKGTHCEDSLQDLVKFIRRDSPFNPRTRLILADFNIVESDLLKLLPLQVQDKKLSFWLIALMTLMTSKPSEELTADQTTKLMDSLRNYKQSFIDRECFEVLSMHIADFYSTPEDKRLRAHYQMQEFIILLLRNLAQIPNSEKHPNLHNHFLAALIKEDIMNPILYILQKDFSSFRAKIDIPLLQIIYYTFTCFDPALVYPPTKQSILSSFLLSKAKQTAVPTRHSRFLPHFQMQSSRGVKKLTFQLKPAKEQNFKGQRKIPQRLVDYKKVVKLELDKFTSDFMTLHLEVQGQTKPLGQIVETLTSQFLEVEFQLIVKQVFNDIFRESPKVNEHNLMEYLLLCSWALEMVRAKYHFERNQAGSEQQRSHVRFELSWVVDVMQNAHFELIYKLLFRETTREKKKLFKINIFNAALKLFKSYLDVISDLSSSMNLSDRKNANVLMANIFRHDISKILRTGFSLISHEGILMNLIKITHKFFKLLSVYSDGRILTIQTNRLLRRKKKHYSDEEQQLQQQREGAGDQSEEGNKVRQDEGRFQERKYNEKSQFAIIAEYPIITKYILFLRNQRFVDNEPELNEAIFFYFTQIKKLLNGEWLFYQAETMCTFQSILTNHDWVHKNKEVGKFVQAVCLSFIKLLRKNPLALVESLFRYSNHSLKEQILKNYSDEFEQTGEQEENMFTDQ